MAISTYSELQDAIANWLKRDDLTDRIKEFIALAEARFNREFRVSQMEQRATASTTSGTAYYSFPNDYLGCRNIQLNTDPKTSLKYLTPETLDEYYPETTIGQPLVYSIVGNEFQLAPIPDKAYTIEISYYEKIPALTDGNTNNWLLTNGPDVYLYGSLIASAPFLYDDQRLAVWSSLYEQAKTAIIDADQIDRWSGSLPAPRAL